MAQRERETGTLWRRRWQSGALTFRRCSGGAGLGRTIHSRLSVARPRRAHRARSPGARLVSGGVRGARLTLPVFPIHWRRNLSRCAASAALRSATHHVSSVPFVSTLIVAVVGKEPTGPRCRRPPCCRCGRRCGAVSRRIRGGACVTLVKTGSRWMPRTILLRCRRQKPRPIARAPAAIAVRAAPFDPAHPALTSTDATVLENVHFDVETEIAPWLAVSNSGTAVYAPKQPGADLVGVARPGGKDRIVGLGAGWLPGIKRISPDSTKAAVRHGLNLGFMTCSAASTSRAAVVNALGGASRVHFRRLSPDHFQERLRIARPMKFDLRGRPVDLLKVFGG